MQSTIALSIAHAALILGVLSITTLLTADESHAQMAIKRSAGTVQRSSSISRQGNTLGSRTRGHEASIDSARDSTSPDSDRRDDDSRPDDDEASEYEESNVDSHRSSDPSPAARGEAAETSRTLGRACIYGRKDQVLYRPPGATCRGDKVEDQPEQPQARRADQSDRANPTNRADRAVRTERPERPKARPTPAR